MVRHRLPQCFLMLCILIMMCPKRSQLRLIPPPPPLVLTIPNEQSKLKTGPIGMGYLPGVSGFDYTDEEMDRLKIWPQAIIPYYIDDFSFDKVLRDDIRMVLKDANGFGGVHFTELSRPPENDSIRYVFFINRRGAQNCPDLSPKEFTTKGVQKVVLGYDCMSYGDLAAIVLAILGVPPQHNAPNRNEHIKIEIANVMPDKKYLYEIVKDNEWLFHELEYDFGSASHYDFHKFTVNGKATIKPLKPDKLRDLIQVGDPTRFSYYDMLKMRMLYNYINQKRNVEIPECSELFKPGKNFTHFQSTEEDEKKPRPKPNRFLGRPDEVLNNNDDEKNTSTEDEPIIKSRHNPNLLKQKRKKQRKKRLSEFNDKLQNWSDVNSDSNRK